MVLEEPQLLVLNSLAAMSILLFLTRIPIEGVLWEHTLAHMTRLAIAFFASVWLIAIFYITFCSERIMPLEQFLWSFSSFAAVFTVIDFGQILRRMRLTP